MTRFWNHNPLDLDYVVAPLDESLANARAMLERLDAVMYGPETAPPEAVNGGVCEDCKRDVETRFRYGQFELCRPCAARRQRARGKAA